MRQIFLAQRYKLGYAKDEATDMWFEVIFTLSTEMEMNLTFQPVEYTSVRRFWELRLDNFQNRRIRYIELFCLLNCYVKASARKQHAYFLLYFSYDLLIDTAQKLSDNVVDIKNGLACLDMLLSRISQLERVLETERSGT